MLKFQNCLRMGSLLRMKLRGFQINEARNFTLQVEHHTETKTKRFVCMGYIIYLGQNLKSRELAFIDRMMLGMPPNPT